MADRLTVRAYAKHRGCSHTAVERAIKRGRLDASVTRDGKHVSIDAALADREWAANTDLSKAPTSVKTRGLEPRAASSQLPAANDDDTPAADAHIGPAPDLPPGASLSVATAAEKYWTAKRKELEYRVRAAELVPAAEVRDKLVTLFATIRTKLLAIPNQLMSALPDQPTKQEVAVAADRVIRESCESLASSSADAAAEVA